MRVFLQVITGMSILILELLQSNQKIKMKYLQFSSDNALDVVSNMVPPLKDTPPASVMFPTSLHLYVATLSADITTQA